MAGSCCVKTALRAFCPAMTKEGNMDATTLLDRLTIRQLVEDWAVLRDARM